MKTKGTKRGLAALLTLVMVLFAVPFTAHAAESPVTLDLAQGTITITETGYTAAGASAETAYTGDYYIMQSNNDTQTKNKILVTSGTHNVSIDGLNINVIKAITVSVDADLTLNLVNSTTITIPSGYSGGISVPNGASLTINGPGALTIKATGYACGIGDETNNVASYGNITINGGNIQISTGYGAAIGKPGGYLGLTDADNTIDGTSGVVTINGGTMLLRGGSSLAGAVIGGGGGDIPMTGGKTIINGGNIYLYRGQRLFGDGGKNGNSIPPVDKNNNTLYRALLELGKDDAGKKGKITSADGLPAGYSLTDAEIINYPGNPGDDLVSFYVPANTTITKVTLDDGSVYEGTVTVIDKNSSLATFTKSSAPVAPDTHEATITATANIPSPTYTVTIPATVDAGDLTQKAEADADKVKSTTFSVSASSVENLFGAKKVVVSLSTADGAFALKNGDDSLEYAVYNKETGGTALTSGADFTEFTSATSVTGRVDIDQSKITKKGSYTGTMTFSISLADIV